MGKEFQKSALPTLFHFARVKAAFQPHVVRMCQQLPVSPKGLESQRSPHFQKQEEHIQLLKHLQHLRLLQHLASLCFCN